MKNAESLLAQGRERNSEESPPSTSKTKGVTMRHLKA
jgi:hypothetical protein